MSNPNANYLVNDAIEFDWDKLQSVPEDCYLVALSLREISVLTSLMRFPEARHLWRESQTGTWADDVLPFVNNLKGALLMGCSLNDLITQLTRIADSLETIDSKPAEGTTTNDVLDEVATAQGVLTPWNAVKAGLTLLFPESAIPISIGLDVIRGLVDNANNNESEVFAIAEILGSTASLPD